MPARLTTLALLAVAVSIIEGTRASLRRNELTASELDEFLKRSPAPDLHDRIKSAGIRVQDSPSEKAGFGTWAWAGIEMYPHSELVALHCRLPGGACSPV